jgi:hypothetical protein
MFLEIKKRLTGALNLVCEKDYSLQGGTTPLVLA